MAAPTKQGIDYYLFSVGLLKDRKFRPLRLKYGSIVGTIYLALLDLIYSDKGYYIEYGANKDNVVWDVMEYLQGKFQPDAETVSDVIDGLVACELFSGDHYPKIITSKRVQETYYRATVDRKTVEVEFDVWLMTVEEMSEISTKSPILAKIVNRPKNEVNRTNNSINRPINQQRRVEKSREDKSRVEESIEATPSPSPKQHFGEFENVLLTDEEFQKLVGRFTAQGAAERIERLSTYLASSGKRYKSHYATILNWAQKDGASERKPEPKSLASKKAIFARIAEEERNAINES